MYEIAKVSDKDREMIFRNIVRENHLLSNTDQ